MARFSAEHIDSVLNFLRDAEQMQLVLTRSRFITLLVVRNQTARLPIRDENSSRLLNVLLNDGHMSNYDKLRRAERLDRTKMTSVVERFIGQMSEQEILMVGADEVGDREDVGRLEKRTRWLLGRRLAELNELN